MNNITNPITAEVRQVVAPEIESVKNLAIAKMEAMQKIRYERRTAREMYTDALENSTDYQNAKKKADEAKKELLAAKQRRMQDPTVSQADKKVKDLTREYNEAKEDVSAYLVLFEQKSGQLSFLAPDGNEVRIQRSAKAKVVKNNGWKPKG